MAADPAFDPEERILVNRTSVGYSIAYVHRPPTRKNYPQYHWAEFDFHLATPSLQPSAESAYFKQATDGKGIFVQLGVYPLLQKDIPLSFMPGALIGAIVNERRGVTVGAALRLARYFETTPQFWLNLQSACDLSVAEAEEGERIRRDVEPLSAQDRIP